MSRRLRWGLLLAVLLGLALGCARSTEPVRITEKLPPGRIPQKK